MTSIHQGFVDDPIAESYDSHGRYYPKETFVFTANSNYGNGTLKPKEDLDLFNRAKRKGRKKIMNRVAKDKRNESIRWHWYLLDRYTLWLVC